MGTRAWIQLATLQPGTNWQRSASKNSYLTHGDALDAVYVTEQGACNENGEWVQYPSLYDEDLKAMAHAGGQLYMPSVRITSRDAFRAVLDSQQLTEISIANLVELATERPHDGPWDGVDIDIELADDSYKDKLTYWLEAATIALHDVDLLVNYDAIASDRDSGLMGGRHGVDFGAIGEFVDTLTVLCYTSFGVKPFNAPGPYGLTDRILEYVLGKGVPPEKLHVGLAITPMYVDYELSIGNYIDYQVALSIMTTAGVEPQWFHIGEDGTRFEFKRAVWDDKEIWLIDRDTFNVHYQLVDKYNLAGVSTFVSGSEDGQIWGLFQDSNDELTVQAYCILLTSSVAFNRAQLTA